MRILETVGSVRIGIVLLNLIVLVSLLGMLIRQHSVPGFESYLAELGPVQRILFSVLGFFDIYHTWYFYALLALLALNILFASIERFPKTLRLIRNPNITPSTSWVASRDFHAEVVLKGTRDSVSEKIAEQCRRSGFRKITANDDRDRTILFGQRGAWNRLGAYPVHVALFAILLGGLLSSLFGFTGEMSLSRGQTSDEIVSTVFREGQPRMVFRKLPFSVLCTDLEQKLKDPNGSIEVNNSLDWVTHLQIKDGATVKDEVVRLNHPFDYRGFRFFHSTFLPIGKARTVLIRVVPEDGKAKDISLRQDQTKALPDGTELTFIDFRANLQPDRATGDENSTTYQNPAAILEVRRPGGSERTVYVFQKNRKSADTSLNSFKGLDMQLQGFERVSETHVLFVQYDPGTKVLYAGFLLLVLSLGAVFLFSHRRIWIVVEEDSKGDLRVTLGGDTNRNHLAFERRFHELIRVLARDSNKSGGG